MKNAVIIVSDISTVFEPKDYLNVGYEQPVTLKERIIYPDKSSTIWN